MLSDVLNPKGDHPDVVVNGEPQQIKNGSCGEFWKIYCELVSAGKILDVKQVSMEAMMLTVRFDNKLDDPHLQKIVGIIQKYLKETLVFDRLSDNDVSCIVTGSNYTTSIYFPSCRLIAVDMENIYIPAITTLIEESIKDIHISVHRYSSKDPVSLYGSTPEKFMVAYDEIEEGDEGNDYYIDVDHFDHLHYTKVEQEVIKSKDLPNKNGYFWLPMILAIDYWRSISRPRPTISPMGVETSGRKNYDVMKMISGVQVTDNAFNLDTYLHFIDMWDPNRVVDMMYWTIIGQAFHTLERGDNRGLNGWIEIVNNALKKAKQPNYFTGQNVRKKCTDAYQKFVSGEVDACSLGFYARIDKPKEYELWHDEWVTEALLGSLTGTESDIARVFYRCYWLEYMASAGENKTTWYRHQNHRLVRDLTGISLRTTLSGDFRNIYNNLKEDVLETQKISMINQPVCELILDQIKKIIASLGKPGYKRNLLSELSERFNVENILSFIDANPDITLVKNGVICVSGCNIYFRDGKPQDYLVKSFDASYRQDYHWAHPKVQELLRWSFITFIDPDTVTFHWKYLASLLKGCNNDKKIMFWSGSSGNNMKTTWQRFVGSILGNKCMSMPINYFTIGKGAANGATPAEIRLEGCRMMFSEEPESKVPLLTSIVKSEVGNEKKQIRPLYGESKEIVPQHKTCIVCNDPPPTNQEGATEERMIFCPFETQATFDAPATEEEQIKQRKFPRNPFFDRELPGLIDAGLWIMYHTFPLYAKEGLRNPPKEVVRMTTQYWDSIDKYSIFINAYLITDPLEAVDGFELYAQFDQWHQKTYKRVDTPDKQAAIKQFSKRLGEPQNGGIWYGFRLRKR
jgi:phage/plasmid-associated DNA primase